MVSLLMSMPPRRQVRILSAGCFTVTLLLVLVNRPAESRWMGSGTSRAMYVTPADDMPQRKWCSSFNATENNMLSLLRNTKQLALAKLTSSHKESMNSISAKCCDIYPFDLGEKLEKITSRAAVDKWNAKNTKIRKAWLVAYF